MRAPDWLTARPVAHRGLHDVARGIIENMPGAAAAAIAGHFGIECDIQLTADGVAMVHHDDELGRLTDGSGCTLIPTTDDTHAPAAFYPYYSITSASLGTTTCAWQLGSTIPGSTTDFGKNNQYGSLLPLVYLTFGGGGSTNTRFNNFRQILANPCPAGGNLQH